MRPKFLLMPMDGHYHPKKHNIYKRCNKFEKEDIIADFIDINWQEDTNYSMEKFHNKIKAETKQFSLEVDGYSSLTLMFHAINIDEI